MVAYDSKIIYQFADRLYKQADTLIWTYGVIGALIGLVLGYAGTLAVHTTDRTVVVAVVTGVCAAIGVLQAQRQAFELRLKAQTALCQARIEENTRKAAV